jgi:hypothetical protein
MTELTETLDEQMLEFLLESYGSQLPDFFAKDDLGWKRLGDMGDNEVISREVLVAKAKLARTMSVADPLIRRLVSLKTAYIFGSGVEVAAQPPEDGEQDVDAVIQGFMLDDSNVDTFSSSAAREEVERILQTDGNLFTALPTDPRTGRVQVRRIPFRQIVDKITDPEDANTTWFYKREWTAVVVEPGTFGGATTRTRTETRRQLYPDLRFRASVRPKTIDGIPVAWDTPILHTTVNRQDGSKWGVPDLLAALPWAEGYKEFLQDWAKLVKALSRFAFRATAKGRNSTTVRNRIAAADPDQIGATVIQGEGQKLEAIGKSGATIDSESGRPLAAMVASAGDVPVTMLLGDPGVSGARATAETLDQPMQLGIQARRKVNENYYLTVLNYVIDKSIEAPLGTLKGTMKIDPVTKRLSAELANDQQRAFLVDWPSLEKTPIQILIDAIVKADGTNLLPEPVIARMLLVALDADDVDEIMEKLVDANGDWIPPRQSATDTVGLDAAGNPIPPQTDPSQQQPPPQQQTAAQKEARRRYEAGEDADEYTD